jgi:hypothetical protein
MKASTHKMRRLGKLLVWMLVFAAIAVPAAGARTDAGMGRVDADVWGVSEYAQPGPTVRGENYYARGIPREIVLAPRPTVSPSTGFQWGDAGIGAGIAFALTLLAGGSVLVVRRQRGQLRTS